MVIVSMRIEILWELISTLIVSGDYVRGEILVNNNLLEGISNILKSFYKSVDFSSVEDVAKYLVNNNVIVLPCAKGSVVYKIRKFCEWNTGYAEEYKPSIEFEKNCPYFEPQEYMEDVESCKAAEDRDQGDYCSLYLNIICDKCKERFAIQKDRFDYSMLNRVYNTVMFDENTSLEDRVYLSMEDAEKVLKELLGNE